MTGKQLKEKVEATGCYVEEEIWERGEIDIQIVAPDGKCWGPGWHTLVTHWFNDWPHARDAAWKDAKGKLSFLEDCPEDCDCKHEDE